MMARSSVFHMSLNRPKLVLGVGSEAFGLLVVVTVLAINLRSLPLAMSLPALYLFLRWVYRKDAVLLKAFMQYLKQADLYDPWVHSAVVDTRPKGCGRGLHC
jgi:type IV secretory pathway VirB3-like protein